MHSISVLKPFIHLWQVVLPLDKEPSKRSGSNASNLKNGSKEDGKVVEGVTGETVAIRKAPDLDAAKKKLQARESRSERIQRYNSTADEPGHSLLCLVLAILVHW